jgi:hypothetical protein
MRIGLAIDLSPTASAHTDTFLRAVRDWTVEQGAPVHTILISDERSRAGGESAARSLVEQGVCAVVGHFSSHAAAGALPIYTASKVPVFLPAATDPALGLTPRFNVGRLCLDDDAMARWLERFVHPYAQIRGLTWNIAPGVHGDWWHQRLETLVRQRSAPGVRPKLTVVIGSEAYARELLRANPSSIGAHRWLLVDDAASERLLRWQGCQGRRWGLGPRSTWVIPVPGTVPSFYWETYVALDLARAVGNARSVAVAGRSFQTRLGPVRFDATGVADTAGYGLLPARKVRGAIPWYCRFPHQRSKFVRPEACISKTFTG